VKRYYTVQEAAPLLKLSEKEIYGFLSRGELKGFKRGRRWHISRREIQKRLRKERESF